VKPSAGLAEAPAQSGPELAALVQTAMALSSKA